MRTQTSLSEDWLSRADVSSRQGRRFDTKVLIVNDDPLLVDSLTVGLQFHWPNSMVIQATDVAAGMQSLHEHAPDLAVVDVDLPDRSAFRAVREIRAISTVPLIVLAPDGNEEDAVRALDLGADACVVKPFGLLVLIARTKALLRRVHSRSERANADFVCGDLAMDFLSRTVTVRGVPVKLTPTEYKVLYYLVRNAGRVTTRTALSHLLWDEARPPASDHLKVFICRLRSKIEPENGARLIVTERGRGYRFVTPPDGTSYASA